MKLFCQRKDSFDRLFAKLVQLPNSEGIFIFNGPFQRLSPNVPGNGLLVILALGALMQVRAACTDLWIAFVLAVTFSVCCGIGKHLIVGAEVAVIEFVIHELGLLEKAFLCLGPLVSAEQLDLLLLQQLCNCRGLVGAVALSRETWVTHREERWVTVFGCGD